jgi:hypothetical protein
VAVEGWNVVSGAEVEPGESGKNFPNPHRFSPHLLPPDTPTSIIKLPNSRSAGLSVHAIGLDTRLFPVFLVQEEVLGG